MVKATKLVVAKRGRKKVLLVRRRSDGLWMFPGGKRKGMAESPKKCMRRELREELPKLRARGLRLWKNLDGRTRSAGKRMSDAVFVATVVKGSLAIGDRRELAAAAWRKPWKIALTPTSAHIRDRLLKHGLLKR